MSNLKLIHQLFVGKVTDEIGEEKTRKLLKEAKEAFAIPVVSTTVTCEHVRGSVIVTDDLVELECRKCGKRY